MHGRSNPHHVCHCGNSPVKTMRWQHVVKYRSGDHFEGRVRPRRLTHCRVRFRRRRETDISPISRSLVE